MKVEACSRSRAVALWCQFRSELGGACSLLSASSVATPTSTLSTITPHPPDYIPPCYQDYSNTCKYSRFAITFYVWSFLISLIVNFFNNFYLITSSLNIGNGWAFVDSLSCKFIALLVVFVVRDFTYVFKYI